MPKKPPKHHKHKHKHSKHPKPPPHHHHDHKSSASAYLDEEICIEAKVTVNPDVSIGEIKVECLDAKIEPYSKSKHAHDECTLIVSQLVRVKIPVRFSAKATTKKSGVSCKQQKRHDC